MVKNLNIATKYITLCARNVWEYLKGDVDKMKRHVARQVVVMIRL